jgi:hypothetical protein
MVTDTQRLSKPEFEFLVTQAAEAEQIQNISLYKREGNDVKFQIYTNRYLKKLPTRLVSSNRGWLIRPFYIFDDLSPEDICDARSEAVTLEECGLTIENPDKTRCKLEKKKSCFYDYAQVSGDKQYCDYTANFKGPCLVELGLEIDLEQLIADCYAFPRESEQADCLLELGKSTEDIQVCHATEFERTKYTCYGVIAAAKGSVHQCEEYIRDGGFYNSFRHALCILSYVRETKDFSKCQMMNNDDSAIVGALKEECSDLAWA